MRICLCYNNITILSLCLGEINKKVDKENLINYAKDTK